ncbi:MAG: PqqD family protein [Lachnospiraceae bacterium]|nr:PqqD family protein [Lachnospiraceae bacterium]
MKEKKQNPGNYLDYIPKQNALFSYAMKENGRVEVKVTNRGLFNRIAQVLFRRPKYSYIELDEFGTFVWQQVDGEKSIYDICILIKEQFGDKAEPLFERATLFFQMLCRNAFIVYENKK